MLISGMVFQTALQPDMMNGDKNQITARSSFAEFHHLPPPSSHMAASGNPNPSYEKLDDVGGRYSRDSASLALSTFEYGQ